MNLYEAIKELAKIVQQTDNIELYQKLLELSKQARESQEEVNRLFEENAELKKRQDLSTVVIRHTEPVVTREDDKIKIYYCAHCWDNENKLIQVSVSEDGTFTCPHCGVTAIYDYEKREEYQKMLQSCSLI